MTGEFAFPELTDVELSRQLVEGINCADDLFPLLTEEGIDCTVRAVAARKLIEMWEDDCRRGVTIDHIACAGDHADEPYKSRANQIICTNTT